MFRVSDCLLNLANLLKDDAERKYSAPTVDTLVEGTNPILSYLHCIKKGNSPNMPQPVIRR
jgi:hypothetical protein